MKSSIPRDWRRILGRWVARGFVYAAAATARREGHVWTLSTSSKRPDAVIRLYRVILPVSDIERAAQFYGALLDASGSRVSPGRHNFGCGGVILACFDPRADGDPCDASPNPDHVYFSVTDLEGTLRSARDAGAVILRPIETQPWGERSFYCTDPFGNKLCFVAVDTLFTAGLLN